MILNKLLVSDAWVMISGGWGPSGSSDQVTLFNWMTLQECQMPSLPYRTAGINIVKFFFNTHLSYSLNFTAVCLCHVMGGIPPPSRGIVGKNLSTQSKTTVRN